MNELVESVGEGGPDGICSELILLKFKRLGAICVDMMIYVVRRERERKQER